MFRVFLGVCIVPDSLHASSIMISVSMKAPVLGGLGSRGRCGLWEVRLCVVLTLSPTYSGTHMSNSLNY